MLMKGLSAGRCGLIEDTGAACTCPDAADLALLTATLLQDVPAECQHPVKQYFKPVKHGCSSMSGLMEYRGPSLHAVPAAATSQNTFAADSQESWLTLSTASAACPPITNRQGSQPMVVLDILQSSHADSLA